MESTPRTVDKSAHLGNPRGSTEPQKQVPSQTLGCTKLTISECVSDRRADLLAPETFDGIAPVKNCLLASAFATTFSLTGAGRPSPNLVNPATVSIRNFTKAPRKPLNFFFAYILCFMQRQTGKRARETGLRAEMP